LPAAIGAALTNQEQQVICFIGDGGLQMNIQELQTLSHYRLNIQLIVMNNQGYGIIKQFQDSNFGGRHFASGSGYSTPDFEKIAFAYDIKYKRVTTVEELEAFVFQDRAQILELCLHPDTLICPKVEMNRFLHDQFPYLDDCASIPFGFDYPSRPSDL
jgi:acetolactate synthase-1/2/3 large subunit